MAYSCTSEKLEEYRSAELQARMDDDMEYVTQLALQETDNWIQVQVF